MPACERAAHALEPFILDLPHALASAAQFHTDILERHRAVSVQTEPPHNHRPLPCLEQADQFRRLDSEIFPAQGFQRILRAFIDNQTAKCCPTILRNNGIHRGRTRTDVFQVLHRG